MEIDPVATAPASETTPGMMPGVLLCDFPSFHLSWRFRFRQETFGGSDHFYETNNPETYSALSVDRCVANNSYRSLRRAWCAQPKFELAKFCGAPGENRRANAKEHQGAHWPA